MSKQLDEAAVIELQYIYDTLGVVLKSAKAGNVDRATDLFIGLQATIQRSTLFTFDFGAKEQPTAPTKKPGIQPPEDPSKRAFPEPPKDGGALGHIPTSILNADKQTRDIDSHVMEHWNR